MDEHAAKAYVERWVETGRLLDEQRWLELSRLDAGRALQAADALIEAALRVPLPPARRTMVRSRRSAARVSPAASVNPLFAAAVDRQRVVAAQGRRASIIRGLAVQRWGEPRRTRDVDVALLARPPGAMLRTCSAEDLVVLKAFADRPQVSMNCCHFSR